MAKLGGTLLTFLLFVTVVGFAQPAERPKPMQHMRSEMRENLKAKLNLTDDQEKELQKLRFDLEKKQTLVHAKIQTERIDLKEQILADNPDRSAIEKSLKTISDLQYQLKLNIVDHAFAAKKILTPEQQKIWKKEFGNMLDGMPGRHMGPMGHGREMMRQHMGERPDDDK